MNYKQINNEWINKVYGKISMLSVIALNCTEQK
jgi:Mg2+ and Co2+ transporter CorA